MKRMLSALLLAGALVSQSHALFINGGFESGTLDGWNIEYGFNYGGSYGVQWGVTPSWQPAATVMTAGTTFPFQTLDVDPYNGTYMAVLNDVNGGYHATKIWQEDAITQQDIDNGAKLYVNWGAMLVEPSNEHPSGDQPQFGINLYANNSLIQNYSASAEAHATDPSWVLAGSDGYYSPLYYKNETWAFDLSTYSIGDKIKVELWVADCAWGGHGGYAFLDGIGTIFQPPQDVPEPSTVSALFLGLVGLAGMVGIRRRKQS